MKFLMRLMVLAIAGILISACASSDSNTLSDASISANSTESASAPQSAEESKRVSEGNLPNDGGGGKEGEASFSKADRNNTDQTESVGRKIIRNASLQLESASPVDAQRKIITIAESNNGFVVQSTQSSGGDQLRERDTVEITIRVPSEKFSISLEEIRKTASRVIEEAVSGQDVTEEYVDLLARLKTKKALEEQFLEIMKQARTVQDALNVQRELSEVRGEIEQIEGRKRFLDDQSALSTIKVSIRTPTEISGSSTGFIYELKDALRDGFDGALAFVLGLVRFLIAVVPFLLFIVLPIYLLVRYVLKRKRQLLDKLSPSRDDAADRSSEE